MSHLSASGANQAATAPLHDRRTGLDVWTVLAFLYPLGQIVYFDIVGQLYLIDLMAIPVLLLFLTLPDSRERLRRLWPLVALLALWLGGQVLTDLIRGSSPQDFLRGWSKIILFGAHLLTAWLWLTRRRAYLAAFAIGLGIAAAVSIPEEFIGYEWKFGYAFGLSLVTLGTLFFVTRRVPWMRIGVPVVLLVIAAIVLLQAARANFGILFLTAIVTAVVLFFGRFVGLRRKMNAGLFAALLLLGAGVSTGAIAVYEATVEAGLLGRDALVKYRDQSSGDLPIILGGRSESLVSLRAIEDSPIIGHGSWAKDSYYVELHRAIKIQYGLPIDDARFSTRNRIPSHSFLFGSWVEGGLAGGLFWLWVLALPIWALFHILKREEPLAPLVAFCAFDLTWSILFSPFGATQRIIAAFEIAVLLWTIHASGAHLTLLEPVRRLARSVRGEVS